jgi:hypothetical protein
VNCTFRLQRPGAKIKEGVRAAGGFCLYNLLVTPAVPIALGMTLTAEMREPGWRPLSLVTCS